MPHYLKKLDWVLILAAVLLVGFGLLSIYSSSAAKGNFFNFQKQVIFFAIGILLMVIFSFLDWRIFKSSPYLILALYFLVILTLIGVLFVSETRGAKTWYKIGIFSFDPAEFAKIILIILLAKYFSMRHIEMYRIKHIILSGAYALLPALLVFLQPNLGSASLLVSVWLGIIIFSGVRLRHFLLLVFLGILVLALSWAYVLKDYQKQRILTFIDPGIDPQGMSWNINQSMIAVGSGGFLGQGFGKGSQTQYGFLPESQNDFIFASIAEEFGLTGVFFLLFVYSVLIWRILRIGLFSSSNFSRLFSAGFAVLIFIQLFINVGMNLGILPIVGISLPFVSYGGSGLIASFIGLGILESVRINQ